MTARVDSLRFSVTKLIVAELEANDLLLKMRGLIPGEQIKEVILEQPATFSRMLSDDFDFLQHIRIGAWKTIASGNQPGNVVPALAPW